ncbi:hypothetical protein [Embleya sp. NPDC020886]|uniref:hypothetical protein n=1 Tax=Embleya sp. NPDC020886 TaxID=3363980 RepID=UPI00379266EE
MTPYPVIKASWVIGSLIGVLPTGAGFGPAEWVVLNTATVGMAAIGIAVALALVRPWGMRVPGAPLAFCAWVGTGFLVSALPYAVLSSLWASSGGDSESADGSAVGAGDGAGDATMPGWEAALIQLGFVGMGLGLALALPAYLRRRRPDVFAGRVGDAVRDRGAAGRSSLRHVPWSAVSGGGLGVVWLYWAIGGTWGIAHPQTRDADWRILTGLWGSWALVAAVATAMIACGRPGRLARRLPIALGWIGSGSLFAWSGWKLPLTLYVALASPPGTTLPENLAAAAILHVIAVGTGVAMVRVLVRGALPDRGRDGDRGRDRAGMGGDGRGRSPLSAGH